MNLIEIINEISLESKNQFKPDLKKYGKNFRAISESAVLEVLNPLFKKYNIGYQLFIEKSDTRAERVAAGKDAAGNIIEKLLFVSEVKVRLVLCNPAVISTDERNRYETMVFDGYGTGVDFGDKASGKAYTAAVKYALFKGFRLQYSDDPDAEESKEIESIVSNLESAGKTIESAINDALNDLGKNKKSSSKEKKDDPLATEAQLAYIKGLVVACALSDDEFKQKYGCLPYDTNISMRRAREIIDELKKLQDEKLPF